MTSRSPSNASTIPGAAAAAGPGGKLRVLSVEDNEDDALLLKRELRRIGLDVTFERVESAPAMRDALEQREWDLVLSDYAMPSFGALEAIDVLRSSGKDIPLLIVSGTIGEETAVECLRAGAQDFLLKTKLTRLGAAIERELRSRELRANRRVEEQKLRELEQAHEHQQRVNRFKTRFLANMSHELRTPLTSILGFSELLQSEDIAGALNERQREFVASIHASGNHLLSLLGDILDLSKIEAGRIELRRELVASKELIEAAVRMVHPASLKQGVTVDLLVDDGLPMISVDVVRFRQVLYNLLSNAIKFTPEGGTVTIRAGSHADALVVAFVDTGIGIRPGDLSTLFREFGRIEPENGNGPEGTGLGLAISKRLVELHGGSLRVESEFGRGSAFTVSIPY